MQVCAAGLSAFEILSARLGAQFKPFISDLVPSLRERLADGKEQASDPTAARALTPADPQADGGPAAGLHGVVCVRAECSGAPRAVLVVTQKLACAPIGYGVLRASLDKVRPRLDIAHGQ